MRWMVRLAVLVAAVVCGRQVWIRQAALLAASDDLAQQRNGIDADETEIDALDRSIDASEARLRDMESRIAAVEQEYPNGIPQDVYPGYASLVAEHNDAVAAHNELVARHDALRADYRARVDRHNARVAETNALVARSTGCGLLPEWLRPTACEGSD